MIDLGPLVVSLPVFVGATAAALTAPDRDHRGRPMYRERHGTRCHTNNRSLMAAVVDAQLQAIWESVEFAPDWRVRMAELAAADYDGPTPQELAQQHRRLARGYADGGLSDVEYETRVAEIDERVQRPRSRPVPRFARGRKSYVL